jgi:hypothetical protein
MRPDFGDLVHTGGKNECIFTLHFAKSNVVDFLWVAFQRRKNLVRAPIIELNNFIVAICQKLRWVVQETVNEVIPAGEAEWREGKVCVATKVLTLATLE